MKRNWIPKNYQKRCLGIGNLRAEVKSLEGLENK
jgi:hypothetical protein